MCVCGIPPQPTMSMCYSRIHLNPLVCVHLLCLLLFLTDVTSSGTSEDPPVPSPTPQSQPNATQANCSTACDNGSVSEKATTKDSSKNRSSDMQMSPSSGSASASQIKTQLSPVPAYSGRDKNVQRILEEATQADQSSTNSSTSNSHTSISQKLNDTETVTTKQPSGGNGSSTASAFSQQPVPPDHQLPSPESGTQPVAVLPPTTTTGSPTQASNTGTDISAGAVYTVTTVVTPTTTITPTSTKTTTPSTSKNTTTTHPTTTKNATAALPNANSVVNITTGRKMLPSSSSSSSAVMPLPNASNTRMTPILTTSSSRVPATITVSSVITSTKHNEPFGAGTRVTIVEVEGSLLTRQLVDTASLLSVLLFGLLFLLVTVAVFVTQAYESYRRKDYTQVDYLINGMYTDSGV